jgi:hypothetical protein
VKEVIQPGTLLYVTSGDYSNYRCHGVFIAAKEIPADIGIWFTKERSHLRQEYDLPYSASFLAYLSRMGYIVELDADELWSGDY